MEVVCELGKLGPCPLCHFMHEKFSLDSVQKEATRDCGTGFRSFLFFFAFYGPVVCSDKGISDFPTDWWTLLLCRNPVPTMVVGSDGVLGNMHITFDQQISKRIYRHHYYDYYYYYDYYVECLLSGNRLGQMINEI